MNGAAVRRADISAVTILCVLCDSVVRNSGLQNLRVIAPRKGDAMQPAMFHAKGDIAARFGLTIRTALVRRQLRASELSVAAVANNSAPDAD